MIAAAIQPFDPLGIVLTAVLNPVVIVAALWLGWHADQWQKVLVAGFAAALFAQGGILERRRLEAAQAEANAELDRQLRRVHLLRQEVQQLSGASLARERLAREELNYSREGELIFLLAEPRARP